MISSSQSFFQWYRRTLDRQRRLGLVSAFSFLFFVIIVRLFVLQIVRGEYYDDIITRERHIDTSINASRGHIYVTDRGGQAMQLTENITLYTLYVEPPWIWDKPRIITTLAPYIYRHLCEQYGTIKPDKELCVRHLESFTRQPLFPERPDITYKGQGVYSSGYDSINRTGYNIAYQEAINSMNYDLALEMIETRLDAMIKNGVRERNYLGIFSEDEDQPFMEELRQRSHPAVAIYDEYYVYINPSLVQTFEKQGLIRSLESLLKKHNIRNIDIERAFEEQEYRYIELTKNVHPSIIQDIKQKKIDLRGERGGSKNAPLLHGVGFSPVYSRYYPHGDFMAHIIGYTTLQGGSYYGIEEYFDAELRGQEGKISGLSTSFGIAGSSSFEIDQAQNGQNIFLTIDPIMQYTIEEIAQRRQRQFRADSVSVLVLDPYNGHIKASVNAPTFDPNQFSEYYKLIPVQPQEEELLDNETYVDIPLFVKEDGVLRQLSARELRNDPSQIKMRYEKERLGPTLFKDKNISLPYEPGSIFKTITYGIGIDIDEIEPDEEYVDTEGQVYVEPFYIRNADKNCHESPLPRTFLFALEFSCNVGMVRIAQDISKPLFYNYLEKLEFGTLTHIELAGEDPGLVRDQSIVSRVGFYNNTFGQGLTATPLQMAAAYAALINGGYYVKPTIIDKICDSTMATCLTNSTKILHQVFRPETSKEVISALQSVLINNESLGEDAGLPNYSLGGKSGTSQIALFGRYQRGNGWTNGSFVGIVSGNDPRYIVVVQVRRPRSVQRGGQTAGPLFREVAQFLVGYDLIQE